MKPPRTLACTFVLAALAAAGSLHAARDHLLEEWHLWQLGTGSPAAREAAAHWLAALGSPGAIPRLLDRARAAPLLPRIG